MSTSSFYLSILPLLSLFVFVTNFAETTSDRINLSENPDFPVPKKQAHKLFRELNLSPSRHANIVELDDDPFVGNASKIVETTFRFPFLVSESETGSSNGTIVEDLGHHAGYFTINSTINSRMFYYFFEARVNKSEAPVVVWLSGGPGCSSSLALFYENGPFHITNNLSLVWNPYGWDQVSNVLFVDQPVGTGFSYTSNTTFIPTTSDQAAEDFYTFIQEFLKMYPKYANNDFYITGESYAGHYIPASAARIHKENAMKQGLYVNLKGLAIGNGLTNPEIQYEADVDYALQMNLINDQSQYQELNQTVLHCKHLIRACEKNNDSACLEAFGVCNEIYSLIIGNNETLNPYDIRTLCNGPLCYNFSNVEKFLDQTSVKEALGVKGIEFVSCSESVYDAMVGDWMRDYEKYIPELLEDGIKLLVYAGEYDLLCNWLGNSRWVDKMKWEGQKYYSSVRNVKFTVDGVDAGLLKSYGPLAFLKMHNAGHMVPMDQPKASLDMLTRWIQGTLYAE